MAYTDRSIASLCWSNKLIDMTFSLVNCGNTKIAFIGYLSKLQVGYLTGLLILALNTIFIHLLFYQANEF
jgi:hypothetical protein